MRAQSPIYLCMLYQDDFLEIGLDYENHWLYANWKGYQCDASIKNGIDHLLLDQLDLADSHLVTFFDSL